VFDHGPLAHELRSGVTLLCLEACQLGPHVCLNALLPFVKAHAVKTQQLRRQVQNICAVEPLYPRIYGPLSYRQTGYLAATVILPIQNYKPKEHHGSWRMD
jgi:hypothetical protein